ncbi:hypothetical protein L7F22_069156 [Adiantum nelumboides]|nr:hypothetical protein [Adiantum nelumboides]
MVNTAHAVAGLAGRHSQQSRACKIVHKSERRGMGVGGRLGADGRGCGAMQAGLARRRLHSTGGAACTEQAESTRRACQASGPEGVCGDGVAVGTVTTRILAPKDCKNAIVVEGISATNAFLHFF